MQSAASLAPTPGVRTDHPISKRSCGLKPAEKFCRKHSHRRTLVMVAKVGKEEKVDKKDKADKKTKADKKRKVEVEEKLDEQDMGKILTEASRRIFENRDAFDSVNDIADKAMSPQVDEAYRERLNKERGAEQPELTEAEILAKRKRLVKKAELIKTLATSTGDLDMLIEKHRADIDEELVCLLECRAKAADLLKQPKQAEGIRVLAEYLKRGKQASTASPAAVLLDSVMQIMDPRSGLPLGMRKHEVATVLSEAFGDPILAPGPVNIFGMAEALAEERDEIMATLLEYGEDETNKVTQKAFVREAEDLLRDAYKQQRELEAALTSKIFKQEELGHIVQERRIAILSLREVIKLAKQTRH